MAIVLTLAQALLLILLEWDLLRGFTRLSAGTLVVLLVLVPLIAWRVRYQWSPGPEIVRRFLRVGSLLAGSLAVLALVYHSTEARLRSGWPAESEARLLETAGAIRSQFRDFLASLSETAGGWSSGSSPLSRPATFRRLGALVAAEGPESPRYGWTLWQGGSPWAWAGRTMATEGPGPGSRREGFRIVQQGASLVLLCSTRLDEERLLEGAYLLQSPLEKQPQLPIQSLQEARHEERISIEAIMGGGEAEAEAAVFSSSAKDLHWGEPRLRRTHLFFPLRDPSGRILAVVNLRDARSDAVLRTLTQRCQALGLILSVLASLAAACLCCWDALRDVPRSRALQLASASFFLWTGRLLLLRMGQLLPGLSAFRYDRFACTLGWDLFRSPADLFFTSVFVGAQVWWWDRYVARAFWSPDARRRLALLTLLPLVALALFLARLAGEIPWDARFDLLRVEFLPPDWTKLLVQSGLFLLFGSWLALARTAARNFLKRSAPATPRGPSRVPGVARIYGFVCVATLLYLPLVSRASHRQRETFFFHELLPDVEYQQPQRRDLLEGVLRQIGGERVIPELRHAGPSTLHEGLAYRVWAATSLNDAGLSSSLRIFSDDGRLLSRFGLNLPPVLESGLSTSDEGTTIRTLLARPLGSTRFRVLVGDTSIHTAAGDTLRIQVHLLDEYENLPFIRTDNIYVQLFRGSRPQRTNPELLGSEPLVAFYDLEGRPIYTNLEGGPTLPRGLPSTMRPGETRWTSLALGGDRYRALLKRGPDRILALGFLLPSTLERVGGFVRLSLLGFAVSAGLVGLLGISSGPRIHRPLRRGRFFQRLLGLFLLASLIPLLSLALFFHRFAVREIDEDILAEGLASLGAASRILEDYLAASKGGESPEIRDDVAFWLSRVVRQDINLYVGERLAATSTRELYASGLLSTRLDGRVYERLALAGDPYALNEERLSDLEYLSIAAPISLGEESKGILSLPLAVKKREILRKRADVEEAILIVTVAMLLLLTVLAHHLARRVSEPIAALAEAAQRIEAGDYDAEVRVAARDEAARLIESFNQMSASLRRQREDLRRRSDYIEKILLNATTGVISTNPSGALVTINPAARILLGISEVAPEGRNLLGLLERSEPLRKALSESRPEREGTWQIDLTQADRPISLRVVSLPFRETPESPSGRILLLEDLTETVRSSRLEAWAEMARRIAHEIKNPLTPIQLSADHLRKVYRSGDARFETILEQCLETIQKQVGTLRGIAADFSAYARIPEIRPERVPVAEILEDVLGPYRAAPPPGIRLETRVGAQTPDLFVDRTLTRRALVNLIQNALEAMPDGGTLSLIAERGPASSDGGRPTVSLRVRDTGPGMDPQTRSRLFEPYFSTKDFGTGLGLSIVRKTTEEQGGLVKVQSAPGAGTEVTLVLPGVGEI